MKKYIVKVNGVAYEVEVEEAAASAATPAAAPAAAPAAPAAAPAAPAKSAPEAAPAAPKKAAPANGTKVEAPLPGSILKIAVTDGQQVNSGDVLCILEAMKMENEILAPVSGTVSVQTSKGANVNNGDLLFVIS